MTPATSPTHALAVKNVSFAYGETLALRDVSFDVAPGTLFGVLGPNGSGKTTLFRIISTLLRPDRGTVVVGGRDVVADAASVRAAIGSVFQQPALDEELTVRENIRTAAALYGLRRADANRRIDLLSRNFDLTPRLDDRIGVLSGGLKRRADLIRGLVHSPDLLLLDEPTSALDPVARRSFWDYLSALRRTEGTTMIAATHLMDEAERCDMLAILDRGRLVGIGSPVELVERLGGEAIWIESERPEDAARAVEDRFGWSARVIGRTVQIRHRDPYAALAPLHDSLGSMIHSATIRRPSLEDVFVSLTGRRIEEHELALDVDHSLAPRPA